MENSLLMTLTALLLLGVGEGTSQTPDYSTNNSTNSPTPLTINVTKPTVPPSPCQKTIQNITQFVLARMKLDPLKTGNMCEGRLYLYSSNQRLALCHSNDMSERLWSELCKDMRCGDFKGFKSTKKTKGLVLTNNMTLISLNQDCTGLQIMCEDTLGSELAAYKAATGILIFLILGVILIQFGRPTYKTIRKRFSQKRQSRWIGPTQSQSVSYHRGQGAPNNNTLKRQSFPGLERLTVNASREPSSNRNSDYDSYGYN